MAKFWCKHCDAALVGEYQRCPVCGEKTTMVKKRRTKHGYIIKVITYVHKDGWYVEVPKIGTK